jgi:hypothetical protein
MIFGLGVIPLTVPTTIVGAVIGGVFGGLMGAAIGAGIVIGGVALAGGALFSFYALEHKRNEKLEAKIKTKMTALNNEYRAVYNAAIDQFGERLSVRHKGQNCEAMKLKADFNRRALLPSTVEDFKNIYIDMAADFEPVSEEAPLLLAEQSVNLDGKKYHVFYLTADSNCVDEFNRAFAQRKGQTSEDKKIIQGVVDDMKGDVIAHVMRV